MSIADINILTLRYARPWALNIILGYGSPRYTKEQLQQKTHKELLEEAKEMIRVARGTQTGIRKGKSSTKKSALEKKIRLINAVVRKELTVEQADSMRLSDDMLYDVWPDRWFDIDMAFAVQGVRPSDII